MGKQPFLAEAVPSFNDGGKEGPVDPPEDSILTADEYCSAVSAIVDRVEDVSDETEKVSDLRTALRRLLLARYNPPLPLWWTFTAVEKAMGLDRKSNDPLDFGTAILNFASRVSEPLKALSAVNASGHTALSAMAPIVGLLYDVASLLGPLNSLDGKKKNVETADSKGKKARKLVRKLKDLIKELLSFTFLCHCRDSQGFERILTLPPAPTLSPDDFPNFLYPAFPLTSKSMAKSLSTNSLNEAVIAEIVSVEVVLLQLVVETIDRRRVLKKQNLDFSAGEDEFVEKLKHLAVHSIWAASSLSLSEMLLELLLEKRLPVLDLLNAKEEMLVRGVLFEAVLVDPPLFGLLADGDGKSISSYSTSDRQSVVFMKKLFVARRAVKFFRSCKERSRLMTLSARMTTWHAPPQLLNWLKSQKTLQLPLIALQDPQALTNWLVNTADKSAFVAIFDQSVATLSPSLTSVVPNTRVEPDKVENGEANVGEDALFFVDTAGGTAATPNPESTADLGFTAAAKSMRGASDSLEKKEKMRRPNVLFHRHAQKSTGIKRSRMEIDDEESTDSSGEDSDDNLRKSAKRQPKTSEKEVDSPSALSEESEDDGRDDALTSAKNDQIEGTSPMKNGGNGGNLENQQHEELHQPEKMESSKKSQGVKKGKALGKVTSGAAVEDNAIEVADHTVAHTAAYSSEEIVHQGMSVVLSQETLVVESVSRSTKRNKETGSPVGTHVVVKEDVCVQRSQETVIASAPVNEVLDVQNLPSISPVNPVISSLIHELVTSSATVSGAEIIDALQVHAQRDSEKLITPRKRTRFRHESVEVAEGKAAIAAGNGEAVSVAKSDKMKSSDEHLQDNGTVSKGEKTFAKDGPILSSLHWDILEKGQANQVSGSAQVGPAVNTANMPAVQTINSPNKIAVAQVEVSPPSTALPVTEPIKSPIRSAVQQAEVQAQDTANAGLTAAGSQTRSKNKRGVANTPTTGKKRSNSQVNVSGPSRGAEENMQVKAALPEIPPIKSPIGTAIQLSEVQAQDTPNSGLTAAGSQTSNKRGVTITPTTGTKRSNSQVDVSGASEGPEENMQVKPAMPEIPPIQSPIRSAVQQTEVQAQDTANAGLTAAGSQTKSKNKRGVANTPTTGKKRSNLQVNASGPSGGAEENMQVKAALPEIPPIQSPIRTALQLSEVQAQDTPNSGLTAAGSQTSNKRGVTITPSTGKKRSNSQVDVTGHSGGAEENMQVKPAMPEIPPIQSPIRSAVQQAEVQAQDTANTGSTAAGSQTRSKNKRGVANTPTTGKKRSNSQVDASGPSGGAEENMQVKPAMPEIPPIQSSIRSAVQPTEVQDQGTPTAGLTVAGLPRTSKKGDINTPTKGKKRSNSQIDVIAPSGEAEENMQVKAALPVILAIQSPIRSSVQQTEAQDQDAPSAAVTSNERGVTNTPTKGKKRSNSQIDVSGPTGGTEENIQVKGALPVVPPISSPIGSAVQQTEVQAQGTTSAGLAVAESQTSGRKGATNTPTKSKKRSNSQIDASGPSGGAEENMQVKEEVGVPRDAMSSAERLQGSEDQDQGYDKTPDAKVEVKDPEPVTSVKPSSRKRKVKDLKVDVQNAGSETTDEKLSPRRTRSGRPLGALPPTPTLTPKKGSMRRKLVLDPLEEEK